jgi:short-subunit dehydrogenase
MKAVIEKEKFGPWAVVTGASSGIGKEFAFQLAANGFNLVLVARRRFLLEEIGGDLSMRFGIQFKTIECDLAEDGAVSKIAEATNGTDVGLLISNAGTGKAGRFLSFEEEQQKCFIQLNALSHFSLTHHFGQRFAKRGKGGILLTGAMGATDGVPYMASMAASKAFLLSLGRSLHYEFKELGINITVLITTPTDTPIIPLLGFDKDTMPMKPISPEQCVTESLLALNANKATAMPGFKFRMMNALIPGSVSSKITGKIMRQNNNL